jgi:hypothetical protein
LVFTSEHSERRRRTEVHVKERTVISVEEAGRLIGIGRALAYNVAEELGAIRVGERRLVVPLAPLAARLGLTPAEALARLAEPNGSNP